MRVVFIKIIFAEAHDQLHFRIEEQIGKFMSRRKAAAAPARAVHRGSTPSAKRDIV
jgi:hypothetical protein